MSLDVYLRTSGQKHTQNGSGIFIRENGQTREITRDEWDKISPGTEPFIALGEGDTEEVFISNITHNLGRMAEAAGIYKACWRPEEIGITHAAQLIPILTDGLAKLRANPGLFETFNAHNGWGTYEQFVPWVEEYLRACEQNPTATVEVSR